MKNTKIKAIIITTALFAGLTMFSCKKDDTPAPTATTPTGTLEFHLHNNVDSNEVEDYGTQYTISGGRKITVSKAQLYISGIQLVKLDGSTYNVPNVNLLKVLEEEVYLVGSVPTGNYQSVRFYVGLDSATNKKTPATTDTLLNKSEMWFGSAAQPDGYVFVNFQGTIDTTTAANGTSLIPFSYKIGTSANRKQVSLPNENFTITANITQFVHLTIDYSKLFNGIQLNNSGNLTLSTAADNTNSLTSKLDANIPSMFRYEE